MSNLALNAAENRGEQQILHKKNPSKLYWGLVLANTTSMIGVLRGKICCGSGNPNGAHLHHAFHRLNHIAVDTIAAELVGFGFRTHGDARFAVTHR